MDSKQSNADLTNSKYMTDPVETPQMGHEGIAQRMPEETERAAATPSFSTASRTRRLRLRRRVRKAVKAAEWRSVPSSSAPAWPSMKCSASSARDVHTSASDDSDSAEPGDEGQGAGGGGEAVGDGDDGGGEEDGGGGGAGGRRRRAPLRLAQA